MATSTAEALAMGKWVLVPDANCNVFFSQFANCLVFKNSEQFGQLLEHALAHDPHPMSAADLRWVEGTWVQHWRVCRVHA